MLARIVLLLSLLLLAACAKKSYDAAPAEYYADDADYGGDYARSSAAMEPPPPPPAPLSEEMLATVPAGRASQGAVGASPAQNQPSKPQPARMVHYQGYLQLRATDPEATLNAVVEMAKAAGGYVESLTGTRVSVRVPVEKFEEVFAQALGLGDVLSRSISAEDITEAFTATDLRLRTAKATRERLQALLARATEEQEKLELLRQIQRLSEEIDLTEARLRTLAELARTSALTVEAVPREAFTGTNASSDAVGLRWIHQLSPFRRDLPALDKRLDVEVPEGLVVLNPKGPLSAESADGARLWTTRLRNEPYGDAAFWSGAIKDRLEDEFASAEIQEVGGWKVLRLVEDAGEGEDGYRYLIALRVEGKQIHVVEVFYPGAAQEERYGADILKALRGEVG